MPDKVTKEAVALAFDGYTAEEIQEYIEIATEFLVDILSARGLTVEELRAKRKGIIGEEKEFINAELRALEGGE